MNKKKDFLKNSFILVLGKIFTQSLSFILLPLYTSSLSAAEYGVSDLINTYVIFISPLVTLQIENATFRFLIEKRKSVYESNRIIAAAFYFTLKIATIIFLIGLSACFYFNYYQGIIILLYLVAYMLNSILMQIARGLGRTSDYAKGCFLNGFVMLISSIAFLTVFKIGIVGILISYFISNLTTGVYIFVKLNIISILVNTTTEKYDMSEMLKFSLPLIPSNISWWILDVSDRSIVAYMLGQWHVGIYAVANKFSSIYVGFFNVINLAWAESISLSIKENDNYASEMISTIFNFFLFLFMVELSTVALVFKYFVSPIYLESYYHVPFLLTGSLFTVGLGLYQSIYIALKKTKQVATTAFICAILNIIIHLSLIKTLGLFAASISTCVSYLILFLYRMVDVKKYLHIKLYLDFRLVFLNIILFFVYFIDFQYKLIVVTILLICAFLFYAPKISSSVKTIIKQKNK